MEILTEELMKIRESGLSWNAEQRKVALMNRVVTAEELIEELKDE